MPRLRRLRLVWRRALFSWAVEAGRDQLHLTPKKSDALAWAIAEAKREPTTLQIRTKDGRIQEERSYGRDPRRRPG